MALHSFDPTIAQEIGIIPAILYKNINYWCEHNKANDTHLYDGLYWTYNSIKAYKDLFPYMSEKQIRSALKTLEDKGYIKTGNYNKVSFDHTTWYADIRENPLTKGVSSNCPTGQIELPVGEQRSDPQGKPIPNINTDSKPTDINTDSKKERKTTTFDAILDSVDYIREDEELREVYTEFIKMRQRMKKPLTDYALKMIINEAHKLADGDIETIKAIVNQSIMRSWQGVFPLKEVNQKFSDTKPYTPNTYTNTYTNPFDDETL